VLNFTFVNVLIENAEPQKLLTSDSRWTQKPHQGACLATTRAAFVPAKTGPFGKFNMVRHFGGAEHLVNLSHDRGQRD
jgi:hypothetical protein